MTADQEHADKTFLALAIWREARGESLEAQTGIANVILNRIKRPSWWGKDVTSVIFKKWQFSSLTDPRDQQLTTWPNRNDRSWQQCLRIACSAMDGELHNPVPGADSYYDISIPPPKWAVPEYFGLSLKERGWKNPSHKKGIPKRFGMPHKLIKFPTKERRSIYGETINRIVRLFNKKGNCPTADST